MPAALTKVYTSSHKKRNTSNVLEAHASITSSKILPHPPSPSNPSSPFSPFHSKFFKVCYHSTKRPRTEKKKEKRTSHNITCMLRVLLSYHTGVASAIMTSFNKPSSNVGSKFSTRRRPTCLIIPKVHCMFFILALYLYWWGGLLAWTVRSKHTAYTHW